MNPEVKVAPKVSVVCAWYNRASYIRQTIDSLLTQDFDDYEIIVANDGSTDPSVKEILDSYDSPKLTVIHKENEGFTKTLKMLMETAKGSYIAVQGAGDISYSERLKKQYQYLLENTDVGAVGSGYEVGRENGNLVAYRHPKEINGVSDLKRMVPFTHGSIMYRKAIYSEAGGYDTRFKYCSDWDLYFRIIAISRITSIDEPLYRKVEFNDGFSFSPIHKFSQSLYIEAATYTGPDRAAMVNSLALRNSEIKRFRPKYLTRSAKYSLKFLIKRDYQKSFLWFKFFLSSLLQVHKNFL